MVGFPIQPKRWSLFADLNTDSPDPQRQHLRFAPGPRHMKDPPQTPHLWRSPLLLWALFVFPLLSVFSRRVRFLSRSCVGGVGGYPGKPVRGGRLAATGRGFRGGGGAKCQGSSFAGDHEVDLTYSRMAVCHLGFSSMLPKRESI